MSCIHTQPCALKLYASSMQHNISPSEVILVARLLSRIGATDLLTLIVVGHQASGMTYHIISGIQEMDCGRLSLVDVVKQYKTPPCCNMRVCEYSKQ